MRFDFWCDEDIDDTSDERREGGGRRWICNLMIFNGSLMHVSIYCKKKNNNHITSVIIIKVVIKTIRITTTHTKENSKVIQFVDVIFVVTAVYLCTTTSARLKLPLFPKCVSTNTYKKTTGKKGSSLNCTSIVFCICIELALWWYFLVVVVVFAYLMAAFPVNRPFYLFAPFANILEWCFGRTCEKKIMAMPNARVFWYE